MQGYLPAVNATETSRCWSPIFSGICVRITGDGTEYFDREPIEEAMDDIRRSTSISWLLSLVARVAHNSHLRAKLPRMALGNPCGISWLRSGDLIASSPWKMIRVAFLYFALSLTVSAQFKQTPPAPYPPAVARQKIRTLLESGDPAGTLPGLLVWYRDIVDDELIAAWKDGDHRAELPALMPLYADLRVASAIIEFSWRQERAATFRLAYAPMLGDLMARYPGSAEPFITDLTAQTPELSPSEAEAVCRILVDMPETGNWRKMALQVLPHYRVAVQKLLVQDLRGEDKEKSYRAQVWMGQLRLNSPEVASAENEGRPRLIPRASLGAGSGGNSSADSGSGGRPHIVGQAPGPVATNDAPYSGPRSGTLKCVGDPVLPNAEYVFAGLPLGNLQIDLDGKPWGARLAPGNGQTQELILVNRGTGAQKGCSVRWKVIP